MAGVSMKPYMMSVVKMTISSVSKLNGVYSPEVQIHGMPWTVRVWKNDEENCLAVHLYCTKNNDDLSEWSATARATITLTTFRDLKNALKRQLPPYAFNSIDSSHGIFDLITWDDLLNKENNYVKNDTIQLKVEITVEDPNHPKRSTLKFESIEQNGDCGSTAKFRLIVENVKNLMAVRSPQFTVRGFAWDLTVYKDRMLRVALDSVQNSCKKESCKVTMSVKLLSSHVDAIEKSDTDQIDCGEDLIIKDLIAWNEMLKPENGFVKNGSITLEVELKLNKPDDADPNAVKLLMRPQVSTAYMVISPIKKFTEIHSPEIYIHGVPWEIKAIKNKKGDSLAVYLYCTKNYSSSDWAAPACATIKLLSFGDKGNALSHEIKPYVFHPTCRIYGASDLIKWDDLMDDDNKYVQNDTCELQIYIVAEDPNYSNRSRLTCQRIDQGCNTDSTATFRLSVANVPNLMAVHSWPFILCGMPLSLIIYNDQTLNLGFSLESIKSHNKVCLMTMSVKLLSSNDNVNAIKKSASQQIDCQDSLDIGNIISWSDMLKPENGFVNDDSITLEVKLEANDRSDGDDPNDNCSNETKRRRLECSICLEDMDNQELSTTPCGHMFCTACITKAVEKRSTCPFCKAAVEKKDLRCHYLST